MEGAELALFMVSAGFFTTVLEYPGSTIHQAISNPLVRRVLMGIAMGATAIGIIYSPWGKQSGAHFNPSVTWTFFTLGKVKYWDAIFYTAAQFIGGTLGILLIGAIIGGPLAHPSTEFAVTIPGSTGILAAFAAEAIISFLLMFAILNVSNTPAIARYTGICAGVLLAAYITFEAPLSGMSMNPARTFASAYAANLWSGFWIYVTAPTLGMLAAGKVYTMKQSLSEAMCAKLHHQNPKRCIFCNHAGGVQTAT